MAYDFQNYYGVDPWGDITLNEREWYDPVLRDMYMRSSVYSQYATFKVDMLQPRARTIYFNDLIPMRPNIAPIANRQMEATRLYTDSFQRQVQTQRYGNGVAIHRESELFSYWQRNGDFGLLPIIQQSLGQTLVDHLDLLARNTFFKHPFPMFGTGSASGFDGITFTSTGDKISTEILDSIRLSLVSRRVPFSALPTTYEFNQMPIVVTTNGFIHDLKREINANGPSFVETHLATESGRMTLLTGEVGMYRGFRFVVNDMALLENCGPIVHQTTITAAVQPGDGAADPETTLVEGVRKVGQPGATHYIQVASVGSIQSGDIIAVHRLRASTSDVATGRAVTNGVLFDDPMLQNIEVHAVDTVNNRIILKEPYMMTQDNGKGLETDLGGGVYGYVTKGKHVHTALFLNPSAQTAPVVVGVSQPPILYTPPAIDDYLSMYRITYDFWMGHTIWEPRVFKVWFGAGANVTTGNIFY